MVDTSEMRTLGGLLRSAGVQEERGVRGDVRALCAERAGTGVCLGVGLWVQAFIVLRLRRLSKLAWRAARCLIVSCQRKIFDFG